MKMKVITLLLITTLLSCSNNKEKKSNTIDSKIDNNNQNYVSATIDGKNFKTTMLKSNRIIKT